MGISAVGGGFASVGGLGTCGLDMLEPVTERFNVTVCISLASLVFRD